MDSRAVSYKGVSELTNLKKKKFKKEISRRVKAINKYEKERLYKAWMDIFIEPNIIK